MKKIITALFALAALVSCQSLKEEFQPVFSNPTDPAAFVPVTEEYLTAHEGLGGFTTIADLKAQYKGKPVAITGNTWIKGQVTTSDQTGNLYKEIYIQDATGGIDLKLGKSSLYSEYKIGQWVYVKCDGLTLGAYNGMPQLGFAADDTDTNEYETSYIDLQALIDIHVFRGVEDKAVTPTLVDEAALKASLNAAFQGPLWGRLVTIPGLVYGNEIFALFYPNSNLPHKSDNPENRVFLSDNGTWGVNTWACSKAAFINYLESGAWDKAEVDSGNKLSNSQITKTPREILTGTAYESRLQSFGFEADIPYKNIMVKYASANYISHYFKLGDTDVQVRTSGFAKFADVPLDPAILEGHSVEITGILTIYSGKAQFTLIDDPALSVSLE